MSKTHSCGLFLPVGTPQYETRAELGYLHGPRCGGPRVKREYSALYG